ncbi:MAG TPA: 1-deoxy-D-xylulose-5-phosphate reductoisomerase [Desulfobacteraceae bacterium]|nr:1-deoxy-D-xylulose-5-phosphate reductoisomerase [Desulfobacteraceae bacterium]
MKNILILGSTGSIGRDSIGVIKENPERYRIVALSANRNVKLLGEQIRSLRPRYACITDTGRVQKLKEAVSDISGIEILSGVEGLIDMVSADEVDLVISAISGSAGLIPTYHAVLNGKDIALANKETLVMAGDIVMRLAKEKGVSIIPIDSEHSAIFQALSGHSREDVKKIILTASGGPFRNMGIDEMKRVSPEQALRHPNWKMGSKITIDSSTLMNKGLEIIEARHLFGFKGDQIEVIIHPESIIHSMVEYLDGSIIAQMGIPNMKIPISYALSYPRHLKLDLPTLRFEQLKSLTFEMPDYKRFRCLSLAMDALEMGNSMCVVLNGANEIAVESFLNYKIGFLEIPYVIEAVMSEHTVKEINSIDEVIELDRWAKHKANEVINRLRRG